MCECCKNIRWGKVFLCSVIYAIIAQIIHSTSTFITMPYYMDPAFFNVWSKVMMSKAGPPPASFFMYSILFAFLTGLVLAATYDWLRDKLGDKCGGRFGTFFMFILSVTVVMFFLPAYLLINIPLSLLGIWLLEMAVVYFINFMIFVKMLK